jgi:HlyD family type I secretion membrane fusion protein
MNFIIKLPWLVLKFIKRSLLSFFKICGVLKLYNFLGSKVFSFTKSVGFRKLFRPLRRIRLLLILFTKEIINFSDRLRNYLNVSLSDDDAHKNKVVALQPIRYGIVSLLFLILFFGFWAIFAPIDSAAVAIGNVVLDSRKKVQQHLEGGIIKEIYVKDGSDVVAGQILIKLDDTQSRSNLKLLYNQKVASESRAGRLIAERDGLPEIIIDGEMLNVEDDPDIAKIIAGEHNIFLQRKKALSGKVRVLQQKIKQLKKEKIALKSQNNAQETSLGFVNEQIGTTKKLVANRSAKKSELIKLQKESVQLQGSIGKFYADIAKVEQTINEAKLEIINLRTNRLNEVVLELQDVHRQISDLNEKIFASEDVLQRVEIKASQSGIVNNLKYHTVGGVIPSGAEILEIVPQDDELIVEAKLSPNDIDVVYPGLPARVRFTSFNAKKIPELYGVLSRISPDAKTDYRTEYTYYLANVVISEDELKKLKGKSLYPGMPAEVMIVTGTRSFLSYLFSPIKDSMRLAFRED